MAFQLKSLQQIIRDMIIQFLANSDINDINKGSVISTFIEAAATEDYNQYFQMLNIISNFSLDNTQGEDLDNRAIEYGLSDGRIQASKAFSTVNISDTSFTKKSTKLYAGFTGPIKNQVVIYIDNAKDFPSSGSIIIGRTKATVETVAYSSIVLGTNYDTIYLSAGLSNDHSTDETVILSQGGNRVIGAGTVVRVPASDYSEAISFSTNIEAIILDGETEVVDVNITATSVGTSSNVPAGSINEFGSIPFPNAIVTNPNAVTNGQDQESDADLRNRIKNHIQSLSRGTSKSIVSGIVGVVDSEDNKRVISANLIEAIDTTEASKLVIDDGTGFEPTFSGRGFEEVISSATGGEEFFQLDLFPLVKAVVVTLNYHPYAISNNMTLIYEVNNVEETITFIDSDFAIPEAVTAQEVVTAINNRTTLVEARTKENGTKVELSAKANTNEGITIKGGTANASNILNFAVGTAETLKLYKFDGTDLTLLEKDGLTATIISNNIQPFNFSILPSFLDIQIDKEFIYEGSATGGGVNTIVDATLNSIFSNDSDLYQKYVLVLSGTYINQIFNISNYDSGTSTLTLTGGSFSALDRYQILEHTRIYFSNANNIDFVNPAAASAIEVVNVLNKVLKGMASVTNSNTRVKIVSKLETNQDSGIRVLGGNANSILGFDTDLISGKNKDYILNRYNGQLQLNQVLSVGDSLTAGTRLSRGFIISTNTQPYSLTNGDTISISIDGGIAQVITFNSIDFSNITIASADEIVTVINKSLIGGKAFVTTNNGIMIRTNTFDSNIGSIEMTALTGSANNIGFPLYTLKNSIESHIAAIISGNSGPFKFVEDDNLVIVLDNDSTNKTFDIKMSLDGEVLNPTVTPTLSFTAKISALNQNFINKFLNNTDLVDMKLIWKTAVNPANIDLERTITSYDSVTGIITLNAAMPSDINATDTFIIIPVTLDNVVVYLSNTSTSTLSIKSMIESANQGQKLQISTYVDGSAGLVNITGGTANALTTLLYQTSSGSDVWVENSLWKEGMEVTVSDDNSADVDTFIVSVTPNDPIAGVYKLTLADPLGTAYSVDQNAKITRRNVLNFSISPVQGIDAYKYYTGLLRKIQKIVDGIESDTAYPGIKAAGAQIEVKAPTVQQLRFEIDIILQEGVALSSIIDDVKNAVSSYVNSTKVGEDIILNEIVKRIKSISGIKDLKIYTPTTNVAIADSEIARVSENSIIIG